MGVTGGFRKAIARRAAHYVGDRSAQAHSMSNRDINRFDFTACSNHCAQSFVVTNQRRPVAACVWYFAVAPDESGLGDANARYSRQHAEVTRETKAARVG